MKHLSFSILLSVTTLSVLGIHFANAADSFKGDYKGNLAIAVSMDDQDLSDQCSAEMTFDTTSSTVEIDIKKPKCPNFKKTKEADLKFTRVGEKLSYQGQAAGTLAADGSLNLQFSVKNEKIVVSVEKIGANQISFSETDTFTDGSDAIDSTMGVEQVSGSLSLKK